MRRWLGDFRDDFCWRSLCPLLCLVRVLLSLPWCPLLPSAWARARVSSWSVSLPLPPGRETPQCPGHLPRSSSCSAPPSRSLVPHHTWRAAAGALLKTREGTFPAPVEAPPQQRARKPRTGELQGCPARGGREDTTTPEAPLLPPWGEARAGGWASLTLPGAFTARVVVSAPLLWSALQRAGLPAPTCAFVSNRGAVVFSRYLGTRENKCHSVFRLSSPPLFRSYV